MGSSRVARVYKAGREAFKGAPSPSQDNLLRAMAAMIAEATQITKPVPKAKKPTEAPKLAVTPRQLYEACLERVPHVIACEPYNKGWFGLLGKKLQATSGLRADDLEAFVGWVENGGLDWFNDCTFAHVIKHWDIWVVKARNGDTSMAQGQSAEDYL